MNDKPTLVCSKTRCLNNNQGLCIALSDTRFDKPCPFYKDTIKKVKISPEVLARAREKYGTDTKKRKLYEE